MSDEDISGLCDVTKVCRVGARAAGITGTGEAEDVVKGVAEDTVSDASVSAAAGVAREAVSAAAGVAREAVAAAAGVAVTTSFAGIFWVDVAVAAVGA